MQTDHAGLIMVVDDLEGNREVLDMFLTASGYTVTDACNGLEAVKLAAIQCPNLIFMDLAMPVMDGFTAVPLLRKLSGTHDVPIVAYTANDTSESREHVLRTGFDGFLSKPIDFNLLDLALRRFLNKSRD